MLSNASWWGRRRILHLCVFRKRTRVPFRQVHREYTNQSCCTLTMTSDFTVRCTLIFVELYEWGQYSKYVSNVNDSRSECTGNGPEQKLMRQHAHGETMGFSQISFQTYPVSPTRKCIFRYSITWNKVKKLGFYCNLFEESSGKNFTFQQFYSESTYFEAFPVQNNILCLIFFYNHLNYLMNV